MLSRLVPDIRKTAELVEEISAACREQDIGAEQVNTAIQQLDKVTQQNASASEQMTATSEELASQAEQLQTTIGFFRIDAETGAQPPVREAARQHTVEVAHLSDAKSRLTAKAPTVRPPANAGRRGNGKAMAKAGNGKGISLDLVAAADGQDAQFDRY